MSCIISNISELSHRISASIKLPEQLSMSVSLLCGVNFSYDYFMTKEGYFITADGHKFYVMKK